MDQPRPHVVLICVDQWRGDALGVAGNDVVQTPYLDELADSGAVFEQAYSAAPTCVPARMSLMTGLAPVNHRRVGYVDGAEFDVATTLAGQFRQAGYQTQAIGKMHYWPERGRIGFDEVVLHDGYLHHSRRRERDPRGYDDYLPWLRSQPGQGHRADYVDHGIDCNSMVARPWDKDEALHPTTWAVTEAERFLYRRDPTCPFFLYLSFHRPHPPYDPPAWAMDVYRDAPPHEPVRGDWDEVFAGWRNDRKSDANVATYPEHVVTRARDGYYGSMTHIDHQVRRFLDMLQEFVADAPVVVAFVSDHGEMLGDHGLWRKGYPYEGSARVPLVLAGAGIQPRTRVREIVELRDLMPTLLEAAGLKVPEGLDGASMLPLVTGTGQAPWRDHLHGEHVMFGQSLQWIRSRTHLYVWMSAEGHEQLFDMVTDPDQTHDLARDPGAAGVLAQHRALLVDHLTDRPEGFVQDGVLVAGREVSPLLPGPGSS